MTNRHILVRLVPTYCISYFIHCALHTLLNGHTLVSVFPLLYKMGSGTLNPNTTCTDGGQADVLTPGNGTGDTNTFFATMWVGFCWKLAPLANIPILHFDLSCRSTACAGGAVPSNIIDCSYEASQDSISMEQRH